VKSDIFIQRVLSLAGILLLVVAGSGCSRDMQEQPSFQPQEAPRKHSPAGSVPIKSREILLSPAPMTAERIEQGAAIFKTNCSPCHGQNADGTGPVARYLVLPPFNLRSALTQGKTVSEIYTIVTNGRIVMPSFKGELSAEERWEAAYFVKSLGTGSPPDGKPPIRSQ